MICMACVVLVLVHAIDSTTNDLHCLLPRVENEQRGIRIWSN